MKRRGYTLVELLVVIAIICILMSMVLAGVLMAYKWSKNKNAEMTLEVIGMALESYKSVWDDLPPENHPTANSSEALAYALCRNHQRGETTVMALLPLSESFVLKDTDRNGYPELYSRLGGQIAYAPQIGTVPPANTSRVLGYLLVDPGSDRKLGGRVTTSGWAPDSGVEEEDNIFRPGVLK